MCAARYLGAKSLSAPVPQLRCLCTESSVKRPFVLKTHHLGAPKIVFPAFRLSRLHLSNTERLLRK